MDGGRRFLRSLKEPLAALSPFARLRPAPAAPISAAAPRRGRPSRIDRVAALAARPGVGLLSVAVLFALVGGAGFVQSGGYDDLVAREGEPRDILARAAGFGVAAVTITGQSTLAESDVLTLTGVGPRNSLLFLDAAHVRDRLLKLPLIKSARVLKLYPNRLAISIEERRPYALWQHEGRIHVVSADGMTIDELRDDRFLNLPFVVGEGAEKRLAEYSLLVAVAADVGPRVKAGVLVAGRRWNFELTNGVTVKLPERDPGAALLTLQRLQREAGILDKDILSIDLRAPGRTVARLSEEALAARAALGSRKPHKSGG